MSDLIERLKEGCVQKRRRWCGDCGEMSMVDEAATDALMQEAVAQLALTASMASELAYTPTCGCQTTGCRKCAKRERVAQLLIEWEAMK